MRLLRRGTTNLPIRYNTTRKSNSSKKKVPFGTRKLFVFSAACGAAASTTVVCMRLSSLAEHEDEQRREGEVDEVRGLDEAAGQEELTGQLALRLGLPGVAADRRVTGDAVTDP